MPQLALEEHDPLLSYRRSAEEVEGRVDMTAMVDLVFMLNIFFLVTSAFAMMGELDLPAAKHVTSADLDASVIFTLTPIPGSRELALRVGEGDAQRELPAGDREQQIAEAVEAALRENKASVVIKAPRDVPMREVARVARAAAVNEEVHVHLAVLEKD